MTSIKDQVIYGRRGTGKTHLLKALQERLVTDDQKYLAVYINLCTYKPTLENDNDLYYLYQEYTVEQQKIITDPQRRKIFDINIESIGRETVALS